MISARTPTIGDLMDRPGVNLNPRSQPRLYRRAAPKAPQEPLQPPPPPGYPQIPGSPALAPTEPTEAFLAEPIALCRNGHPKTPENRQRFGSEGVRCVTCRREWGLERTRRARAARSDTCRNGHPRTPASTYTSPRGQRYCRICARVSNVGMRAVCVNGHRQTFRVAFRDNLGRWRCHTCAKAWADRVARGGRPLIVECARGHAFTPENTGWSYRNHARSGRYCKTCWRENKLRRLRANGWSPKTKTPPAIAEAPISRPGPAQAALGSFDALAVAIAAKMRDHQPVRFSEVVDRGIAARLERERGTPGAITPERVIELAADLYGVEPADLTKAGNATPRPRQLAMYLIRQRWPEMSLDKVGQIFGRHHSTVLHAEGRIAQLLEREDKDTVVALAALRSRLGVPG